MKIRLTGKLGILGKSALFVLLVLILLPLLGVGAYALNLYMSIGVKDRSTLPPSLYNWPEGPYHFTYKDYKGEPSLDSDEYNAIAEKKGESLIRELYITEYSGMPFYKVRRLAKKGDPAAMFEFYIQSRNWNWPKGDPTEPFGDLLDDIYRELEHRLTKGADDYLKASAAAGYLPALIYEVPYNGDYSIMPLLDEYEKESYLATWKKLVAKSSACFRESREKGIKSDENGYHPCQDEISPELEKLKQSGYIRFMYMGATRLYSKKITEEDKDILCEARYLGHIAWNPAKEFGISCEGE